jgi:hypothetical protein
MFRKRPFSEHVPHLRAPLHIGLSMRYSLIECVKNGWVLVLHLELGDCLQDLYYVQR